MSYLEEFLFAGRFIVYVAVWGAVGTILQVACWSLYDRIWWAAEHARTRKWLDAYRATNKAEAEL